MLPAHHHLLKWATRLGFTVEVVSEDEVEYTGTKWLKAVMTVEAVEEGQIYLKKPGSGTSGYLAGFSFILDRDWAGDPDESISDWGINDITIAWDMEYTEHCKRYPINTEFSRSNN
jgi:hypothetical protein